MNTLGERLKYSRKKNGYTQESLSEAIGISRGVIFNLEKDKTEPQGIVVNAVCQTLKINKDWLLYGTGEMEDNSETSRSARVLAAIYDAARGLSEEEQLFLLDTIKALKFRLGIKQNI